MNFPSQDHFTYLPSIYETSFGRASAIVFASLRTRIKERTPSVPWEVSYFSFTHLSAFTGSDSKIKAHRFSHSCSSQASIATTITKNSAVLESLIPVEAANCATMIPFESLSTPCYTGSIEF